MNVIIIRCSKKLKGPSKKSEKKKQAEQTPHKNELVEEVEKEELYVSPPPNKPPIPYP